MKSIYVSWMNVIQQLVPCVNELKFLPNNSADNVFANYLILLFVYLKINLFENRYFIYDICKFIFYQQHMLVVKFLMKCSHSWN